VRNSVQHVGSTVEIDIHLNVEDGNLHLDFVDNGPGFDENVKARIFQKGESDVGKGFGLYLSKKIIEIYQGRISLLDQSVYGKGAAIRIILPFAEEVTRVTPQGKTV
jgi:signal transduction histidine kinase